MTSVKRMDSASTTPATQVTPSEPSSGIGPRPTPPAQQLTATMPPQLRSIDWNGHIPHAPRGPVTMTRAQVREQLAATAVDGNERTIPSQRTSAYDDIVLSDNTELAYGRPYAWGAF